MTIANDDEIDYSIGLEFYDLELDDKDDIWIQKRLNSLAPSFPSSLFL